jgi:hypothetical protein
MTCDFISFSNTVTQKMRGPLTFSGPLSRPSCPYSQEMAVMKATLLGMLCASGPVSLLLTSTLPDEYGCRYFKQPKSNGIMETAVPPAKAMDIYQKVTCNHNACDRENTFT